jgi:hypothetical protein
MFMTIRTDLMACIAACPAAVDTFVFTLTSVPVAS